MDITFHGAAQTVTGSQHLIQVNGHKFLLDCGLYQGSRKETYYRNQHFVYDPSTVDTLLLSHAHTDHAGNIPNLVKKGFAGPIKTTSASHALSQYMVLDSARIQENDAEFVNKKNAKRGEPPIEPLYDTQDAEAALKLFTAVDYNTRFEVVPGVTAQYFDAGHILGSAITVLNIEERGRKVRLAFSGDIGRNQTPILRDPTVISDVDYLIMESTYGDRNHKSRDEAQDQLRRVVGEAVERGGKIIIPSFAVGRAQELVFSLHFMMESGALPRFPVYVDSPLAVNVSKVFKAYGDLYDQAARDFAEDISRNIFDFPELTYVGSADESKALNDKKGPMVIISASGMCETGRILHHLRNNIENPRNTILIVSWQAPETLGRRLVEKQARVKIFGEAFNVKARVETINGYSAHADQAGLTDWALALKGRLQKVFLVHGEPAPAETLAAKLREGGLPEVHYPNLHETVTL
ncbi:MAG TPA: MBL fold metallo-hydrolase [Anaerolineales bacterium]|nr:MBL fold metallo-hydrolase [Anaerolineales bacterium]